MCKKIALFCIMSYQKTLSLDHGPLKKIFPCGFCRFNPTCSDYTYQAIEKYGIAKGGLMGAWRIARCNPWSKGGEDPVR